MSVLKEQAGQGTVAYTKGSETEAVLVVFPGFVKMYTGQTDVIFPRIVITRSHNCTLERGMEAGAKSGGTETAEKTDSREERQRGGQTS